MISIFSNSSNIKYSRSLSFIFFVSLKPNITKKKKKKKKKNDDIAKQSS